MSRRQYHAPLDSGNNPENPLRSYRMGMLSHGFLAKDHESEWEPDESGPMAYSLATGKRGVTAFEVTVLILVVAGILAAIFFV